MKLTMVGAGDVGLASGARFAGIGNAALCADLDQIKIAMLKRSEQARA